MSNHETFLNAQRERNSIAISNGTDAYTRWERDKQEGLRRLEEARPQASKAIDELRDLLGDAQYRMQFEKGNPFTMMVYGAEDIFELRVEVTEVGDVHVAVANDNEGAEEVVVFSKVSAEKLLKVMLNMIEEHQMSQR